MYKTLITSLVILNVSMQKPMTNPDPEAGSSGTVKWPLFTLPLDLNSGSEFGTGRQLKVSEDLYE